jgi:DNA-binding CsgD family transcriptional regulator
MRHHLTEKELLIENQRQLFQMNTLIHNDVLSLNDLEELIPGWFHLNSLSDFSLMGVGKKLCEYFHVDESTVYEQGFEFLRNVTCPETQKTAIPTLSNLVLQDDETEVVGFFQRLKRNQESEYEVFYTTSKLLKKAGSIISVTNRLKELNELYPKIEKIFEDNIILKKYYTRFASLSKREKEIFKLIAEGYSSKEISENLFISILTVNKHRQNIIRKLEVGRIAEITRIARAFDLI